MNTNSTIRSLFVAALLLLAAVATGAQEATTPDAAKAQEDKAKLEGKAVTLLEQVVGEAQALKLPENRIRVQIIAGDLLWDRSAARARSFFNDAGAALAQLMVDNSSDRDREDFQILNRLRQDLVLSAGRHDADLGYQLLRQTQPPPNANADNRRRGGGPGAFTGVDNLEQNLLAVIANTDPKVAYQKASEALDKGEYPSSLARVLAQLQAKDDEAFKKLTDKTLSRLTSDNLLSSNQASNVAMGLLRPGPQASSTATTSTGTSSANPSTGTATANNVNNARIAPVLNQSAYHDLLDRVVTAALTATPRTNANGGGGGGAVRRTGIMMGTGGSGPMQVFTDDSNNAQQPADPAQVQQNNARNLLRNLQGMLSQVDQYLPERGQAVRQKLTDMGMNNQMADIANQMRNVMTQGDSESMMAAAANLPGPIQSNLYRQAAQRAIEEGNLDRAQQIAADHLDENGRKVVMQAIDFKKLTMNVTSEKLGEIREKLAALPSDADRVKYLADLAMATQKDNPKLALKFAEDARALVTKRASSYRDLENQLRVAELFSSIDVKRSFDVLEPGISQLNELLAAAQVLNGFEVEVYRDGELPLQGGSELGSMISRYGQQLASLSKLDFERAQITADRFQFAEPRLMAKLAIVQGVFGVRQSPSESQRFNFRFGR
ncbi:MAG TPA: hypothetical protein VN696_12780 [Pyrinomonadaceae bacterium]|nr:hypothetical protein [Pyrinomonadaceae bacterium]